MSVVAVVISGMHHLDVALCNSRLLGKLLAQERCNEVEIAVKQPAYDAESKHIAALQHGLVVESAVCQAVFHHLSYRTSHHAVGVDAHLAQVVVSFKLGLLQVGRTEAVGVDDYRSLWLGKLVLSLQCSSVHGHQHVTLVAGSVSTSTGDVNLKARNTRKRSLRGADVCRIIRKRRDSITYRSRNCREDVSRQLHAVAGVTRKTHYDII